MAAQRLREILPRPGLPKPNPIKETLSKLGLTEEQFKAKQTEMMEVLLRNQPFVPKEPPAAQKAPSKLSTDFYERMVSGSSGHSRSRSESVSSSSSSRDPSPAPRTPARRDQTDAATQRPRDKMELIIEQRNRAKSDRRKGVYCVVFKRAEVNLTGASGRDQHGPVTPSTNYDRGRFKMPLPPFLMPQTPSNREPNSSCPPTPRSSPPPVVNLVSSPGPMRPAPLEEEDCLPYTLPSGPYSAIKPDLSYAAIIGQAILSSPIHALALQDIYEFITTVYPYYKRGEPTWMNSVRHALSTMAVFRKVPRDRSEGKSLWAVWDRDLPCFEGGGFKKMLCADMVNSVPTSKASKKRAADESGGSKAKRRKTVEQPSDDTHPLPVMTPAPMLPPYFPHVTPANPYHQPYYQLACPQQQLPADVLFPPLPPSSNYHRVISRAASGTTSQNSTHGHLDVASTLNGVLPPITSPVERPPSSSSVPELVASHSSSSSPALSSQPSLRDEGSRDPSPVVASASLSMQGPIEDPDALWLQSDAPGPSQPVAPSKSNKRDLGKGKAKAEGSTVKKRSKPMPVLPPPPSPTLERRAAATTRYGFRTPKKKAGKSSPAKTSPPSKAPPSHAAVAPAIARPVTPPSMTASVEEIMRAMEEHAASGRATRSPSPLSEVEVTTMVTSAYSDVEEVDERPSTPEHPPSSSLPSTPPQRLEDLEAELFNFSPFKSPRMRAFTRHGMSPTFLDDSHLPIPSLYSSRAPYLHPDNVDDLLAGEADPSTARSPIDIPRTPKKTPLQRPSSSRSNPRPVSPYGTPSRGTRSAFDDDFASFFQSPGGSSLFDPFLPGLSKSPVLYGLQSPGFGGQY
ncbi:Forkhead box protein I2 [Trametes pubescens]|uniref:Forkhead box protein I2 n=1 Tax=Trametes pubescens TaxID=154538 RepID=A0A1M2VV66_TRAPU|nr:Forkhead box protein I2 [Trametes pubescens]